MKQVAIRITARDFQEKGMHVNINGKKRRILRLDGTRIHLVCELCDNCKNDPNFKSIPDEEWEGYFYE